MCGTIRQLYIRMLCYIIIIIIIIIIVLNYIREYTKEKANLQYDAIPS